MIGTIESSKGQKSLKMCLKNVLLKTMLQSKKTVMVFVGKF